MYYICIIHVACVIQMWHIPYTRKNHICFMPWVTEEWRIHFYRCTIITLLLVVTDNSWSQWLRPDISYLIFFYSPPYSLCYISIVFYAMLKCVSLWNQCDIPHSGIVCDITPLQKFFFDITLVLNKAYVSRST